MTNNTDILARIIIDMLDDDLPTALADNDTTLDEFIDSIRTTDHEYRFADFLPSDFELDDDFDAICDIIDRNRASIPADELRAAYIARYDSI